MYVILQAHCQNIGPHTADFGLYIQLFNKCRPHLLLMLNILLIEDCGVGGVNCISD